MRNILRLTSILTLLIFGLAGPLISAGAGASQKQPIINIDSIQVTAWTVNSYRKNDNVWSWVPEIRYMIRGPVPPGSVLSAEFSLPESGPWVQFDCGTQEVKEGYGRWITCGGRNLDESKGSIHTGAINFAIKMRNELMGTEATLFTGRAKVAKAPAPANNPKETIYYIDHDWNLPIGYLSYIPDDIYGWKAPWLYVAFWIRGEQAEFEPHLLYKGQPVAKGHCEADAENNTSHSVTTLPNGARWARMGCRFWGVKGWNNTEGQNFSDDTIYLAPNPEEYEVKVLRKNRLARSIRFRVGADGNLENGIRETNKFTLLNNRVIVPVQIIGDQDGPWDRSAWKTDAFYGHPLTVFTPPQ